MRRLYLGEGDSSLFTYCTQALQLAEGAAYNCIEAARTRQRFPAILTALEDGAVTLTTVRLVAPHLNDGESRGRARAGTSQGQARGRGPCGIAASAAICSIDDP